MDWSKKRIVMFASIVGLSLIFGTYIYQTYFIAEKNDFGPVLIEDTFKVERDDINYFEINLLAEVVIEGEFEVNSRVCINFYVLNETNFNKMMAKQDFTSYMSEIQVTNFKFTFTPENTGTYFFIFDNRELVEGGVCYDKIVMFKLHQA